MQPILKENITPTRSSKVLPLRGGFRWGRGFLNMKKLFTPLLLLASLNLSAQKAKPLPAVQTSPLNPPFGYAVIRGHIDNHTEPSFSAWKNEFIRGVEIDIPVDQHGNFSQKIKVEGEAMDVMLYRPGRRIVLHDKDTLTLNWDAKNAKQTFTATELHDTNPKNEIRALAILEDTWSVPFSNLNDSLFKFKMTDAEKFTAVNRMYNGEMQTLVNNLDTNTLGKLAVDIYFKYAGLLLQHGLLPAHQLQFKNSGTVKSSFLNLLNNPRLYSIEAETWFNTSINYRDFIYDFVRFSDVMKTVITDGDSNDYKKKIAPAADNLPLQQYYLGMSNFKTVAIRDWYTAYTIIDGFRMYSFDESAKLYNQVASSVKTPYYADTLKKFYRNIQTLKPGMPAPNFTLKDENGRTVSLSQFKGKTVYVDFWGVGCNPCINEIVNYTPALHQRYKNKNIAFINICVDTNTPTWKAKLKELNMHGTNLIAQGWSKHPAVRAYDAISLPRYYIINNQGKIVNNNAPNPSDAKHLNEELDKLVR